MKRSSASHLLVSRCKYYKTTTHEFRSVFFVIGLTITTCHIPILLHLARSSPSHMRMRCMVIIIMLHHRSSQQSALSWSHRWESIKNCMKRIILLIYFLTFLTCPLFSKTSQEFSYFGKQNKKTIQHSFLSILNILFFSTLFCCFIVDSHDSLVLQNWHTFLGSPNSKYTSWTF